MVAALLVLTASMARAGSPAATWTLEASTLTYHVSHPLHHVEGISHAAKGKGTCAEGRCDFLVAVPVKSFDSGDSNRDLHMIQTTRGAEHPLVAVRVSLPESEIGKPELTADVEIEFAGEKARYAKVLLHRMGKDDSARLTGTIPLDISDFKIIPPSLLSVPIKLQAPVDVDLTWRRR